MFPIEAFQSTLAKAIRIFRQHGIRFHLTGGIASVYYGEPRLTQDIDIVIDNKATRNSLTRFLESLEGSDFLFDAESVHNAVADEGMFQLLDAQESLKLDVYPRELIPGELSRSVLQEVFEGETIPVVSCGDAAVSKLIWVSKGSAKSRRDLRQIFHLASQSDRRFIEQLSEQLGLLDLLHEVLAEQDIIE